MATRPRTPSFKHPLPPGMPVPPALPVHLRRRRWRVALRLHGVSPRAIRLLSRCRQRKPASWLDLNVRDLPTLYMAGVIPEVEITFVPRAADAVDAALNAWRLALADPFAVRCAPTREWLAHNFPAAQDGGPTGLDVAVERIADDTAAGWPRWAITAVLEHPRSVGPVTPAVLHDARWGDFQTGPQVALRAGRLYYDNGDLCCTDPGGPPLILSVRAGRAAMGLPAFKTPQERDDALRQTWGATATERAPTGEKE